jgi:two-component system sensor histidine kinase MprB
VSGRFAQSWRGSLRVRFTLLAVVAVAVAVVGVAVASWLLVSAKLNRQFDDQLRSYAEIAARADSAQDALDTLRATARGPARGSGGPGQSAIVVQFISASGQVETAGAARGAGIGPGPSGRVRQDRIGRDQYRVYAVPRGGGVVQVASDAEEIERTLADLGLLHGLIGLVGVLAAAGVGFTVARAALRPVDELTAATARVARTRELTGIPVRGTGEIARLTASFNAMLAALDSSRAAQRRLVEDAGHELRTPLTSLRT